MLESHCQINGVFTHYLPFGNSRVFMSGNFGSLNFIFIWTHLLFLPSNFDQDGSAGI